MKRILVGGLLLTAISTLAFASDPTLLLRVERRAPDDLAVLRAADIPVVAETLSCLFVEGGESDLAWLAERGWTATKVDSDPRRSDYLLVGLRPDSDRGAVEALGSILLAEENWVLLRVSAGAPLEPLLGARVFVTRLPHEPVAAPVASPPPADVGADAAKPLIQQIVNSVSPAAIDQYWYDLTANPPTGTRYSTTQGCRDAAQYVGDEFVALGIPTAYENWSTSHAPNTVGTWTGALTPDVHYVVEGHLDDLPSSGLAPGADDNASGCVAVLEAARVLSCYATRSTVKFLTVTGEEFGLYGSNYYADQALARGDDIRGVINYDMIGWAGDGNPTPENLDVDYNAPSQWLGQLFATSATEYGTGLAVDAFLCPSLNASDHYPFWQNGYPAICGITDNEGYCGHGGNYPYYHTSNDTIANCGAKDFFYGVVKTTVATLAELAEPFKIALDRTVFGCGETPPLGVVVGDRDLNGNPSLQETATVAVWSTTESAPEDLVLTEESANSMVFRGSLPTTTAPPVHGDGMLSVSAEDTITARYVDALDCNGAANVAYTATAGIDCTSPVITGVGQSGVTDAEATITWTTDEPSDSAVHWGQTIPPAGTATGDAGTTSHSVHLSGLQSCTVYYFDVRSADAAGNLTVDDAGGRYYHFETLGNFGSGLQPCHAGKVSLDRQTVSCSDTLPIRLVDMDLNVSPAAADTVSVSVTSSTETQPETVVLTETGVNTSVFTGSVATASVPAVHGDGILSVGNSDAATATYRDANDGTGVPAVSCATGVVDCAGPGYPSVRVASLTDASAVVTWTTSEPTTGRVDWGPNPSLGSTVSHGTLGTSHSVTLQPLTECGRFYFRVYSTDAYGNTTVFDALGSPLEFNAYMIPGIFRDGFETLTGWTLEGEWQIAPPEGKGHDNPDPTSAFAGTNVLGHDLTGLGKRPGDYEPTKNERASSPVINAAALTGGQLKFRRWLNTGGGGVGYVEVKQGPSWVTVWHSDSIAGVTESAWSLQTINISPYADGNASLQIGFRQYGGLANSPLHSGWNVDRLVVKSASSPDFDACGACGGAPSFAGIVSTSDADPCGDTGVAVSWKEAPSWGTGHAGTYSVYRSTDPGFTPSAANRVGTGVTGLSWTDASAPNDVTLYYIVRAENDETCSTGPNNGGVTDSNLVRTEAIDQTSQPAAGDVGGTLRAAGINGAHVLLTWSPAANAARYHVYRSQEVGGPLERIAEVAGTSHEDRNQMGEGADAYYRVRAADSCGNEGP